MFSSAFCRYPWKFQRAAAAHRKQIKLIPFAVCSAHSSCRSEFCMWKPAR